MSPQSVALLGCLLSDRKWWSLLSFSQCTHCPRRSSVKNSSSDPSASRFWVECHPWKGQGCQSLGFLHISAEEKLKVFYFLKPGFALPFTSQMQLLETSKTCWKQRIFSALLSLCSQLFLFQHWLCQHQWGGEAVQKVECWQKPGSSTVWEKDSRLESLNIHVSVCTHHSSSILPALAWTSSLRRPSASFPISPADIPIQSKFLMSLHSEVVLRTDKPDTFVFCPQGNLRYSMT